MITRRTNVYLRASAIAAVSGLLALAAGMSTAAPLVGHDGNIKYNVDKDEYRLKGAPGRAPKTVPGVEAERNLSGAICAYCHEDAIDELKNSVHFKVQGPNPRVLFPGGGAHGALDRACGLPGTTALINYNSDVNLGECGKCHVGRFIPPMEGAFTSNFMQMGMSPELASANAASLVNGGLDCLICHAEHYLAVRDDVELAQIAGYTEPGEHSPTPQGFAKASRDNTDFDHDGEPDLLIDGDGDGEADMPLLVDMDGDGEPESGWPTVAQDRSYEAVLSVGKSNEHTCLRCHEHARTGYKRGTLFLDGYDIHATADEGPFADAKNRCTVCHEVLEGNHKFVRGHLVGGDMAAADYVPPPPGEPADPEDPTHLTCVQCHDPAKLPSKRLHSEEHLAKIACETCHIPYGAGITYSMYGHGGHFAFGRNEDGLDTKLITTDHMVAGDRADIDADYEAYKVPATLVWFNGATSFLAQTLAVRGMENAKITPFKPMANGMIFDGRFFDGVMTSNQAVMPDGSPYLYNAHSMYRFFANALDCDELSLPDPSMCGDDGLYGNAEVFTALGLLGDAYAVIYDEDDDDEEDDASDDESELVVDGLTPEETRVVTVMDLFDMSLPSKQAMAMMQIFPNMINFSKAFFGYEHYLIGSPYAGSPMDADGNGVIDMWVPPSEAMPLFNMQAAANMGLQMFKGFNKPMFLPEDYDWVPPFDAVDEPMTMKAPDGSLMKMFLQMQGMQIEDEAQRNAFMAAVANYPAFSNGVTLGGHGVQPKEKALGAGGKGREGCLDCHGDEGVLMNPIPVTKKQLVYLPMPDGPVPAELPIYRWKYYNMDALTKLGLATENQDVLSGEADIDIDADAAYVRASSNTLMLNWFMPNMGFFPGDADESLAGTELTVAELTLNGGPWMAVLEPVTEAVPTYAVLGYQKDEIIWNKNGKGQGQGPKKEGKNNNDD